jgi:predicted AAA+ superfamily ATPase
MGVDARQCFFWSVHAGSEVDLVIQNGSELLGFEFKRTLAPKLTRSMRSALAVLDLAELTVVYPGRETFPLADAIVVKPVEAFIK